MDGFKNTSYDYVDSTAHKNTEIYQGLEEGTDKKTKKETQKLISEGQDILSHLEKKAQSDPDEYQNKYEGAIKEYEELRSATMLALQGDRKIIQSELSGLKSEFNDVKNLSERWIDKRAIRAKKIISTGSDFIEEKIISPVEEGINHLGSEIEEEIITQMEGSIGHLENEAEKESLKHTPWKLYNQKQARKALAQTQKIYESTYDIPWPIKTLAGIDNNGERDGFQLNVIGKIIGKDKTYSDSEIVSYNEKTGYNLMSIELFETELNNTDINNIESKTLKAYLESLKNKHGADAGNVLLRKIKDDLDEDGINGDIIQDFLEDGSMIIDGINRLRSAKGTKKTLEASVSNVKDPLLQEYVKDEIEKLEGIKGRSWDGKDWSLLLLSVIFKQNGDKRVMLKLGTHEQAQINIITQLNSEGGKYIIGHTDELSYYPIKIKDYQEKIEGEDIGVLNPLALANYLDHLDQKKGIDTIFQDLPYDKLETIQKQLQENNKSAEILEKRGLGYITDIIINFSPTNKESNILESIDKLDSEEEQKSALAYIKRNISELNQKLYSDIKTFLIKKYPNSSDEEINERVQEVMIIIEKLIIDNADLETIIGTIHDLGMDIDLKKATTVVTEKQKQYQAQKIVEAEIEETEARANGDIGAAEAARTKAESAIANLDKASMNATTARKIAEDEYKQVASGEKTVAEIVEEIKKRDPIFANEMKEYETRIPLVKNIQTQQKFQSEYHILSEGIGESGDYFIKVEGIKVEGLTQEEVQACKANPKTLDNTVNAYNFFESLNCLGVWKYRTELCAAAGTVSLDHKDDSFKLSELALFGRKLIQLINNVQREQNDGEIPAGKKLIEDTYTLAGTESELRKYTEAESGMTDHKSFGLNGEDKITNSLRQLGIIGGAFFHTMKVRDMMNQSYIKTEQETKVLV